MKILGFVQGSWTAHQALHWLWHIMIAVHVGLGVAVIAGGAPRFTFPTYKPLLDMVHGHVWVWGLWILSAAFLMSIPARWPQITGLWLGMTWQIMWCSLFAVAIVTYPTAGATAAIAYGGFAAIDAALLTARLIERDERKE